MPFRDRIDAGRRLADEVAKTDLEDPIVVGLPRGGVPVAAEVATELGASLDVLVVRKIGCPWQPELGVGAIGEGDVTILDADLIRRLGLTREQIDEVIRRERAELERRIERYRGNRQPIPVAGRTVILVDDGIATGSTARAAIDVLRQRGVGRIVLATPVAPRETVEGFRRTVDEVVVVETPPRFSAIGEFYDDFAPTTDEEVARAVSGSRVRSPASRSAGDPERACEIDLGTVVLEGDLAGPVSPKGLVVFAHGSGSSRHSPRNRWVAGTLNQSGFATLLFDLLTPREELDRTNVFDIELLADRLEGATRWVREQPETANIPIGYFGASTGAGAALWAAADLGSEISTVVSRGGRPDLAGEQLPRVTAPTLLIVGGRDDVVIALNREAQAELRCESALEIVPGATHLFEEPGTLDRVAELARSWFEQHLDPSGRARTFPRAQEVPI